MSRFRKDKHNAFWNNAPKDRLILTGMVAAHRAVEYGVIQKIINAQANAGISIEQQVRAVFKWFHRRNLHEKCKNFSDQLRREKALLYVGLEQCDGEDSATFRHVTVPYYFLERLKRENEAKEKRDREVADLRERISTIRMRVFLSRAFPVTLRTIIFERDNYTCRVCLRNREKLLAAGLHLECDHILAWEDGGMTTYDNGQTVCSECNKAKHHSKVYLRLVARLSAP